MLPATYDWIALPLLIGPPSATGTGTAASGHVFTCASAGTGGGGGSCVADGGGGGEDCCPPPVEDPGCEADPDEVNAGEASAEARNAITSSLNPGGPGGAHSSVRLRKKSPARSALSVPRPSQSPSNPTVPYSRFGGASKR